MQEKKQEIIGRLSEKEEQLYEEKFKKLRITDDYMFFQAMQNKKLCKTMLETILGIKIRDLVYVENEKKLQESYDAKGVRLDVYAEDKENTVYNMEMQTSVFGNLAKRSRYYQGQIDGGLLRPGDNYEDMKKSIVIFICTFDMFNKGLAKYTFNNMCREVEGLELGDGATKIFLNSKAVMRKAVEKIGLEEACIKLKISKDLFNLLDYIETGEIKDTYTEELEREVEQIRKDSEWRRNYMVFEAKMMDIRREARLEGRTEGIAEGIEKGKKEANEEMSKLMRKLLVEGKTEEIMRVCDDPVYKEKLMREYGITTDESI